MYLKFISKLNFPALAKALCTDLTEDTIDWDSENVYEWMYVDLPQLDFSLNVSREHGWAEIDDALYDLYEDDEETLTQHLHPGPVYLFGWNRQESNYVDALPDFLPAFVADRLSVDVSVYPGRINVDIPDAEPIAVVTPDTDRSES